MKQLAIIGATASGKSDLAIKVAKKIDAHILSIDSLSIYKEINIVSAKPSKEELSEVKHFGIDYIYPNEYFSVEIFLKLYKESVAQAKKQNKNLVIVGGTSFYLKSLMSGLSKLPKIDEKTIRCTKEKLKNISKAYDELKKIDPKYMQNINPNDRYRIEKALLIYEASKLPPTEYFRANPPKPILDALQIYNISTQRDILRKRITQRTKKMLKMGLIDEVCYLEQKYTRKPNPMKSIGIVEVFEYLDNKISLDEMQNLIITHTAQLAKRQETFNRTQFDDIITADLNKLESILI